MSNLASAFGGSNGERVALVDVAVAATLRDLLAEVGVTQRYRNDEAVIIEAVYTFALPLDAVLLELEVTLGERRLAGVVVEKAAAERGYEEAIESGDAAVMLERIEPGLYTMNVGNLLPREEATISVRYATLYRWSGDQLRLLLPTTIAPRYGVTPHQPHQVPEASLTVENRFALQLQVMGCLSAAQFDCPSHEVELTPSQGGLLISLRQANAVMDRDFVLNVRAPQAARSFALCGRDGNADGNAGGGAIAAIAAIASFQPFFAGLRRPRPLNLVVVVDCSGSMTGDSIAQARQALAGMLDALRPDDRVTLIAFGSGTAALSPRLLPCTAANLEKARSFAAQLDADMGGTEIGGALRAAYTAVAEVAQADLFLITDGEVGLWEDVVGEAERAGHRIFTVGVGAAVSEAFVRGLAEATGGACELVSPREGMAERIVRHFERMRAARAKRVSIHWPAGAEAISPRVLPAVFEGDTVIASAGFARLPAEAQVVLEVETEGGQVMRQALSLSLLTSDVADAERLSTVARLAAAARLADLDDLAGAATALRYRLLSRWTNWLVVAERTEDEKAQGQPALRKVPQTLAAGWGGVGTVMSMAGPSWAMAFPSAAMASADWLTVRCDDPPYETSSMTTENLWLESSDRLASGLGKLVQLIEAEPARLNPGRALGLLLEAGLDVDFDDLFEHARLLNLDVGLIASMVVLGLLDGVPSDGLSDAARGRVASLRGVLELAICSLHVADPRNAKLLERVEQRLSAATRALGDDTVLVTPSRETVPTR